MIFPESLQQTAAASQETLPLYRDWAVDWKNGRLLLQNGMPFLVEGREALKVWIYKALRTRPATFVAYAPGYGLRPVSGLGEADEAAALLQQRIIRALSRSPYITGVGGFSFTREEDWLRVSFTVDTVYGNMETEVMEEQ